MYWWIDINVFLFSFSIQQSDVESFKIVSAKPSFPTNGSVLDFFNLTDGLDITWYHGANSQEKIQEAIDGHYMMIEGDITLRWYGYPNQTEEPIMAHPPDVDSDLTLEEWVDAIIASQVKGMKLDFKNNDVVRPSLEILASRMNELSLPVWINADVVRGPMGGIPVNAERFLNDVNELFPDCTLSLGWTTGCCFADYSREMMENMWNIVQNTTQPVTYPARAALFKDAWDEIRWLLAKDPERSSITVWTPSGSDSWEGASEWDMLYCRNDEKLSTIFYDLPGEKFESFRNISITAGSLVNYFDTNNRDALEVTWAHAVNSQDEIASALESDIMVLEADVIVRGQGTENETDIPVMAHPPDIDSDITLQEWLDLAVTSDQGIKLDFKSIEALEHGLPRLADMRFQFRQPVFINADILKGPNTDKEPVNSTFFKVLVNEIFPWATLSIGWTTGWTNTPNDEVYDNEMVNEMLDYVSDIYQPITYPIRAVMLNDSWSDLKLLLDDNRGATFTVWSSSADELDTMGLVDVRESSEIERIYYDLPEEQMEDFLQNLNATNTNKEF